VSIPLGGTFAEEPGDKAVAKGTIAAFEAGAEKPLKPQLQ
jgi:hypothetical protein